MEPVELSGKSFGIVHPATCSTTRSDTLCTPGREAPYYIDIELTRANVVLVCFDLTSPESFNNLKTWTGRVRKFARKTPVFLVGMKLDLLYDTQHGMMNSPIGDKEVRKLREKFDAVKYAKCSARSGLGVEELFEEVSIPSCSITST